MSGKVTTSFRTNLSSLGSVGFARDDCHLTHADMGVSLVLDYSLSLTIKSPRPLHAALDREPFLITDKQTEILGCIPCVMVIFLSTRQAKPIYLPLCAMHIV